MSKHNLNHKMNCLIISAFVFTLVFHPAILNAQAREKLTEQQLDDQAAAVNHKRKHFAEPAWFRIRPGDTIDLESYDGGNYYFQVYFSDEQLHVDIFRNDKYLDTLSIGEDALNGKATYQDSEIILEMSRFHKKHRACRLGITGDFGRNMKIPDGEDDDWTVGDWSEPDFRNDAYGHIWHTSVPLFTRAEAKLIKTESETKLQFMLGATFENYEDEEAPLEIKEAWVYVSLNGGAGWKRISLEHFDVVGDDESKSWALPEMNRTEPYSHWMAAVDLKAGEINEQTPIIYFFGAKDSYGNVTTELPETAAGYLPNPMYFIPAATDEDNPPDVVPGAFDIWNTYVGRDNENLYLAAQMDSRIDIGSEDYPYSGVYIVKFSNPKTELSEGRMVGKILAFSPILFPAPVILDIASALSSGEGPGRVADACIGGENGLTNSALTDNDFIFYKVRIKDICPEGCDAIRIIHLTYNMSDEGFMPYAYNCSPLLYVYFRSHSIGQEVETKITSPLTPNILKITHKERIGGLLYPHEITPKRYQQLMSESLSEEQFIDALKRDFNESSAGLFSEFPPYLTPEHITYYHEGPGPFYVTPCDIVKYKNYTFEVYTRNKNLKVRLFRDGALLHTLMINEHTKPRRDEQHKTDDIYITLSNFQRKDMSCTITIEDLK